jgi:hypothetical protein
MSVDLRALVVGALAAGTLVGCAAQSDQDSAATAAARFLDAARTDPARACALLTPHTRAELETSENARCGRALPTDGLGGAVRHTDTWSDQARVDTDGGVVFLSEFESGWLVSAAGCRPNGEAPYLCVLGG